MPAFRSLRELDAFVRALPIPEERRDVVADELVEHVMARVGDGATEAEALASLGDAELLARLVAPAERRFRPSNAVVVLWATAVGLALIAAEIVGTLLWGRIPIPVALLANLALGAGTVALALPPWAKHAAHEARVGMAVVGWAVAAFVPLFVDLLPAAPATTVGPMVLTLWIVPSFVLIGCRIDRVHPPEKRKRSKLELRLF